jgi:hypothetical protein
MSVRTTTGPSGQVVLSGHAARLPKRPAHPERVCWGCPLYCAADDMRCGGDTLRAPHPSELFGEDWDLTGEP